MPLLPITSLLAIALEIYQAIMGNWVSMLEHMTPAQREQYLDIIVAREQWWQENIWDKLGDFLDGPDEPPE